jgi:hypothetical protein
MTANIIDWFDINQLFSFIDILEAKNNKKEIKMLLTLDLRLQT